ncbi:MAG: NYN domain-containing protein [Actinomycetota bacterium]
MKRIYLLLDAENLLAVHRREGTLAEGLRALGDAVRGLGAEGAVVQGVAFCDADLCASVAWDLAELGVRTFVTGETGPDASDRALTRYLETSLPDSAETVVIGSGDNYFARSARRLRREGRAVEMLALPGSISWELYAAVEHCTFVEPAAGQAAAAATHEVLEQQVAA